MQFKNRLIKGLIATFIAIGGGTAGYKILGGPEWSLLDAVYMTIITLTTVGFGETGSVCQSICQDTHHLHHSFWNGKSSFCGKYYNRIYRRGRIDKRFWEEENA